MNVLIAIALIAAGAVFYWVLYRALPKTSGTIETQVTQPVEVRRDGLGVPHIKARSIDDAWFVQGYTTAEDRMFQMDGLRRLAAGELSEVFGPSLLDSDREARRLRMRRVAEQIYTEMTDSDKAAIRGLRARGERVYRIASRPIWRGVHADRLRSAPLERGGFGALRAADVPYAREPTGKPSSSNSRCCGAANRTKSTSCFPTAPAASSCPACDATAGLERVGRFRRAFRHGKTASLERYAPRIQHSGNLAHGSSGSSRHERHRCCAARHARDYFRGITTASRGPRPISASTCRICTSRK